MYFTSNKSSILELCDWMGRNPFLGNPFKECRKVEFSANVNYQAKYTDMMLYTVPDEEQAIAAWCKCLQIVFEWCTNTTLTLYKGTNFSWHSQRNLKKKALGETKFSSAFFTASWILWKIIFWRTFRFVWNIASFEKWRTFRFADYKWNIYHYVDVVHIRAFVLLFFAK